VPDEIPSAAHSAAMIVNLQHHIADEHKQLTPTVGKVLTPPPNLSVEWNNIVITKEQIYLNEYWLPGHTRHIVGETDFRGGGSGDPAYESHNHPIDNDETWTDTLKPGDFVSVYPQEGGQLFIIENKLVKL
jgi:hypothetical protein